MAIEGFNEILNIVYIAKKLHELGRYELVKRNFYDSLSQDAYYENMYSLISELFEYHYCRYYEDKNLELHVISDPVITDFYVLAGGYGKLRNIPDEDNPYIEAVEKTVHDKLNFSYCLDWMVMGHPNPKRPYHSRIGLFISQDDWVDLGLLAYRLIEIYEWYFDKRLELRHIMDDRMGGLQISLREGVRGI